MAIKIKGTQINPDLFTDLICFFQEAGVESVREEIRYLKFLALSFEICEYDVGASSEFPDYLTARSTRRRQRVSVCNDCECGELAFTFGERLPNRDSFRAHGQAITRALDVTAGVNLATGRSDRRTNLKS
jgi:hypothetical protein